MRKHSNMASKEMESVEQDRGKFLEMAIRNYAQALIQEGTGRQRHQDLAVFR